MKEELHNEIVGLHSEGCSIRSIARRLGISRYQVARVLAAHRAGRDRGSPGALPKPKQKRASSLDEYEERLAQLLARYSNITAVRAHEELVKLGFAGGYGIIKRRLRQLQRPDWLLCRMRGSSRRSAPRSSALV